MINKTTDKNIANLFISIMQQNGIQLVNLVVQILLARILDPKDFGIIGVLLVFYAIGVALSEMGLNLSIIKTNNLTNDEINTIFTSIVAGSIIIFLTLFFLAPILAVFYRVDTFVSALRVYSSSIILYSFSAVYIALLTKKLKFKVQLKVELISTILAGILSYILAVLGYGFWSLIYLHLSRLAFKLIGYFLLERDWTPKLYWNFQLFRKHILFGYKITGSTIIGTSTNNAVPIIIGSYFNLTYVGYFTQGNSLARIFYTNVNIGVNKVFFALFSKSDKKSKENLIKYLKLLSSLIILIVVLVLSFGEGIVLFLYGDKWGGSIYVLKSLIVGLSMLPVVTYFISYLNSNGQENYVLRLNLSRRLILLLLIFVMASFVSFNQFIAIFSAAFFVDNIFVLLSGVKKIAQINNELNKEVRQFYGVLTILISAVVLAFILDILGHNKIVEYSIMSLILILYTYFMYGLELLRLKK